MLPQFPSKAKILSFGFSCITLFSVLAYVTPKLASKECLESAYRIDSTWVIPPACQQYRSRVLLADLKGYIKQVGGLEQSPIYLSKFGVFSVLFPALVSFKPYTDEERIQCIAQAYKDKDKWVLGLPCIRKQQLLRSAASLGYTEMHSNGKTYLNDKGVYYVVTLDCPLPNSDILLR